jgi:hypothetical protein
MTNVIYVFIFVLAIIFGPLALIWALNTLFPALLIPYTFETWLAAVVFNMFFVPSKTWSSK